MPTSLVCLTYDFDALSIWIAKGMVSPTPLSRGAFGVIGVQRILDLLAKHSIPGTFFVPGHTVETFPDSVCRVVDAGHEIGHHGWTHRRPADLGRDEEEEELLRGLDSLQRIVGVRPTGYRSPAWDLSPYSLGLLVENGFSYDSSLMGHDYLPYRPLRDLGTPLLEPTTFGDPVDLIEMPVAWSLDDFPMFEFAPTAAGMNQGLRSWKDTLDNWIADYDWMRRHLDWGVITYTFHPFVSGRGHRLMAMEALIEHLTANGAEFVTMAEAAGTASRRLAEGTL